MGVTTRSIHGGRGRWRKSAALQAALASVVMAFAAHALALEAVLVTDNTAEFARVAGLPVENWLRPTP